ncbi:hypothetical protein FOA52_008903 [Chlamydomonas sp. UWO 241]|nr:hypothetical protein FOA52_008903 [Chlamydomonas sp. UWO 241]
MGDHRGRMGQSVAQRDVRALVASAQVPPRVPCPSSSPPPPPAPPPLPPQPFTPLGRTLLAGGTLEVVHWERSAVPGGPDRMLRVWTPPGFVKGDAGTTGWPVLYLNDGQNLFIDRDCFSGCSWRAAETAAGLIAAGVLPPFVVVGIDHSGITRSLDYCPYAPGTGPGGFRADAANWPGGCVDEYMVKVVTEVMPFARSCYNAASSSDLVAFGGSSFGGICTLVAAMRHPGLFDAALVESPSLWLANEAVLKQDVARYSGDWPQRMFIGMGDKEYSGVRQRSTDGAKWDALVAGYAPELYLALLDQGVEPHRLCMTVDAGATHNEASWSKRLPAALTFLLAPWWGALARRASGSLFTTFPKVLRAGCHAGVLFDSAASTPLVGVQGGLKMNAGFNGWEARTEVAMQRLSPSAQSAAGSGGDWHVGPLLLPRITYEMAMSFGDAAGTVWDSNEGSNYYARVSLIPAACDGRMPHHYMNPRAWSDEISPAPSVDEVAQRNTSRLFFTFPEKLVAGEPALIYVNRRASKHLRSSPKVHAKVGWNAWEKGCVTVELKPSQLPRGGSNPDWWCGPLAVPANAEDVHLAFTNAAGGWESNWGDNYIVCVGSSEAEEDKLRPRSVKKDDVVNHAGGRLHVMQLSSRVQTGDRQTDRNRKWAEEKILRVWTPQGYSPEAAPEGGWPVLFFNDAQNMFECWLAHQGVSWRLGFAAADLIARSEVPPFVIVGIDNHGPMRSLNYLPYEPGSGVGAFREDAARWPGGGVEKYMERVIFEVMPMVTARFNLSTDPRRTAFGGASFGGINALHVAMNYAHVFGSVLAESPSLWIAEGRMVEDLQKHTGMLPERLFMGCGTLEYSATRDHDKPEVDALLMEYYQDAARALEYNGLSEATGRLQFVVEEGAGHHERAWQCRLTGALKFLLSPWKDGA